MRMLWVATAAAVLGAAGACKPINVSITFGRMIDDFTFKEAWRVFFITEEPCNLARLIINPKTDKTAMDFELLDVYRSSINIMGEAHSVPYLRFTYAASIPRFAGFEKFEYMIESAGKGQTTDAAGEVSRSETFQFESSVYSIKEGSTKLPLKILAMADHKFYRADTDMLIKSLKEQKWDLLVMMGDYAYELFDDYGVKGDEYFNAMQPSMTRAPFLLVGGNHDITDFGRLLHFRFRFPRAKHADENMALFVNVGPISFFIFNLDLYYWNTKSFQKDMDAEIERIKARVDSVQVKAGECAWAKPFRVFVTHRAFYCVNRHLNDRCNIWPMMSFFEPILQRNFKPDLMLTGHKHLYQRLYKGDLEDLPWFDTVNGADRLPKDVLNVIVGTAGLREHDLYDTPSESRIRYRNMNHLSNGFLIMEVDEKIKSTFYSVDTAGKATVEDQFEFDKSRALTELTKVPAPLYKTAIEREVFANLLVRNMLTAV